MAAENAICPLAHLTTQSAAFGEWEVLIYAPESAEREYMFQGKPRTSYTFRCLLVSTKEPTHYVLGESRGKAMNPQVLKDLMNKFRQGLVFHMTKPSFVSNVKQQYNSAPKCEVVVMMQTTFTPVLRRAGHPTMLEPSIPIYERAPHGRLRMADIPRWIDHSNVDSQAMLSTFLRWVATAPVEMRRKVATGSSGTMLDGLSRTTA